MRKMIKCSKCNKTFSGGYEYRMHWEKYHYDYAIKFAADLNKRNEKDLESMG